MHVVDVMDYQNGTIPDLLDLVGHQHPVYVIANKIDLLPKDSKGYLRHVEHCVTTYAQQVWDYCSSTKIAYKLLCIG